MPILTIERSSEYANRIRKIYIFLDGKKIGHISNGETKSFDIPAGTHTVWAKVDWGYSNKETFTTGESGRKKYLLTSFAKHNPLGIFATIYYITFGYKKYLRLTEQAS